MIPVPQRIVASGNADQHGERPGDCMKCCYASVLERRYEDVPHFVANEWRVAYPHNDDCTPAGCTMHCLFVRGPQKTHPIFAARDWMRTQGYTVLPRENDFLRPFKELEALTDEECEDPLTQYERWKTPKFYNEGYWIATVVSENYARSSHAVVMRGNDVAFDPSPHARRTAYEFIGQTIFVAEDPSRCRR